MKKKAEKFVKNLDFTIKTRVIKQIKRLEFGPFPSNKKHILETIKTSLLCELVVDKLRIYYTVEDRFIVIEEIEYSGLVNIIDGKSNHKSGDSKNYPNQRRDISNLKKWFYNFFKKK